MTAARLYSREQEALHEAELLQVESASIPGILQVKAKDDVVQPEYSRVHQSGEKLNISGSANNYYARHLSGYISL